MHFQKFEAIPAQDAGHALDQRELIMALDLGQTEIRNWITNDQVRLINGIFRMTYLFYSTYNGYHTVHRDCNLGYFLGFGSDDSAQILGGSQSISYRVQRLTRARKSAKTSFSNVFIRNSFLSVRQFCSELSRLCLVLLFL